MAIKLINNINDIHIDNTINLKNKTKYGEIFTDVSFVNKMLDLFPIDVFKNPDLIWLDPCAGKGNYFICLYYRLLESLKDEIPNVETRKSHIIENMFYMIEINKQHIDYLKILFGENANIYEKDFLLETKKYDVIIGNPPFNCCGYKKTPTNKNLSKKTDGLTIWPDFVRHAVYLLKDNGYLSFIHPAICMKPDKSGVYNILCNYQVLKLHTLTNTETNTIFHKQAQTPCIYYLLLKKPSNHIINIYDKHINKYINYSIDKGTPIPMCAISIINKMRTHLNKNTFLKVFKTNMPKKDILLYDTHGKKQIYKNIYTCVLKDNIPTLQVKYTEKPCVFYNQKKLVLAHGMYSYPYIDFKKEYGIANRDKYVILRENDEELIKLYDFFNTKIMKFLVQATRYRMMFLEKYLFELIPDVSILIKDKINDKSLADFFNFDTQEIKILDLY